MHPTWLLSREGTYATRLLKKNEGKVEKLIGKVLASLLTGESLLQI